MLIPYFIISNNILNYFYNIICILKTGFKSLYISTRNNQDIATEIVNKTEDYQKISGMFPTVKELLPVTNGGLERLRPFETLKLNPPQYICPFYNEVFTEERFYKRHLVFEHEARESK